MNLVHVIWLSMIALEIAAQADLRPNHAAINTVRKHIDVDSSWLDKNQKEVQQVCELGKLFGSFNRTDSSYKISDEFDF